MFRFGMAGLLLLLLLMAVEAGGQDEQRSEDDSLMGRILDSWKTLRHGIFASLHLLYKKEFQQRFC